MTLPSPSHPRSTAWALAAALLLQGACKSPEAQVASADREVYRILDARREAMGAQLGPIHIEPQAQPLREELLLQDDESPPVTIGLVEALSVAAENSREYQRSKETLYLAALDLTLVRYRYQVQQSGTLGALLLGQNSEAEGLDINGGYGFTKLLGSGALIVGDIGLNMFRSLTTGDSLDAISNISLSITQPLLRGYGERIVMEPLTQAERNVVYAVRDYERFRRTFGLQVYTRYLRLVQQLDTVANQRTNVDNLTLITDRNAALAAAGRLSDVQADQARQDVLNSRDRLIQEEQRYDDLLDDFKFFLGLPPQSRVQIVPDALERLSEAVPEALPFNDPNWLAEHALVWRLDHQTVLDEVDDAQRKTVVAADALQSALDVRAGASSVSTAGTPGRLEGIDWTLGLSMDFAIDRLPQRNSYRESLIRLTDAQRSAEENDDSIRLELRDDLREADRTLETWKLQRGAVALAQRRVESTALSQEAGRAETRDLLDAQEALLDTQNAATRALIDQRLAVLNLWLDLEILRLEDTGLVPDPELLAQLETPRP